ncbi:dienelactone hydrolase family protein [Marivibrio halodurans]|uniref:Dienelactone hydrolase family protein n=1 Tax=Marivibrio halodurans TaxID=2039722 RepID=A0A8J7V2W4_9PROT|nr:dienelactone hydrolase family protein [Marivibrio halodurans]MBP5857760.1 dienelactone hydrolase family protein [Marivibrio halodurans]
MGDMIKFDCPEGHQADGYLAEAENPKGAVVVIQEWWGLNDQIKGVADRFAAEGYTALAPDLFAGRIAGDADEANHIMTNLDWVGAVDQEVKGAARLLKGKADKVAVMGFCMGGALSIIAGVKLDECDAAICYYGIPPKEQADPRQMRVPFQAHFATNDGWCTPEAIGALEQALKESPAPVVEIHRYDGEHAFFNETSDVYDKNAAETSWDRTIAFLDKQFGS